ncbi:MAG: aldo/keto reductase [Treponema sp.]|nr:aldo/keto reductase [Candidatus Treponema equifaecale]
MEYVALGKTNLLVSRTAFGAMGLGKIEDPEVAYEMIDKAYKDGINFFDTSMDSPESERRLGEALGENRKNVYIATKSTAHSSGELSEAIDNSLTNLKTDYIDLYQLEKPNFLPEANGDDRLIEKLLNLKESGVVKHFGITTESMEVAQQVLNSEFPWETIQFPFNMLCDVSVEKLTKKCYEKDIGFIAMQPLCGGVISNIPLALGYFLPFDNVVPVWGARSMDELQQILYFTQNPPRLDDQFMEEAEKLRAFFN